jgi:hypothetical protein
MALERTGGVLGRPFPGRRRALGVDAKLFQKLNSCIRLAFSRQRRRQGGPLSRDKERSG